MLKNIIYALVDPLTDQWRYVGKSTTGLTRPRHHVIESKRDARSHKARWVNKLAAIGLQYRIEILEEFESKAALNTAEKEWIAECRRVGVPLTNATDGGDAGLHSEATKARMRAYRHTPERIEKIRLSKLNLSSETRKRMSIAASNRKATAASRAAISAGLLQHYRKRNGVVC